jgi:hypothetical protein
MYLPLQIPCLRIVENLTDVVDRSLYGPDLQGRGGEVRWIDLHWLGNQGLLAPRTQGRLWELGPGGMLVVETRSGLWELGPGSFLVLGTRSGVQELGPNLGFGAQGGLRDLGPKSLLILWPSCGVRVLGPKISCRSSL